MKRLNQTTSFFLIGFSVLIIISSLKVGVGSPQAPGPGFMGFLASLLLLSLSLVIFAKESLKSAKEEGKGHFGWENLSKQFILTVALCGYAFLLEILGFLLSSFILMWIMLLIDNPRKWFYHMVVAFIVANVSYLVLYKLLRVVLPAGIFRIGW
ncbi:MAG: tripartite tricarboxylate transporter TctB family protein [Thermodesulfobacteriota bacterium]|nr:tripartite tricarboxylate transporter TctB family protein [Thermodesulfobacteriota bacterium]